MFGKKLVQIVTVALQAGLLAVLFVPAIHDYELSLSLWNVIATGYQTYSWEDILTYSVYYIPVLAGILLVALLESRLRYGVSLLSASMGLMLTLSQYLFPALGASYLFPVYQWGLYLLLALECAVILFSFIGICQKDAPAPVEAPLPEDAQPDAASPS